MFSAWLLVRPPMCSVPKTGKSMFPLLSTRYCCRDGWLVRFLLFAVMGVATVRLKGMAASGSLVFTVMVSKSLGMMCASYRGVWTFAMFRYSEPCR